MKYTCMDVRVLEGSMIGTHFELLYFYSWMILLPYILETRPQPFKSRPMAGTRREGYGAIQRLPNQWVAPIEMELAGNASQGQEGHGRQRLPAGRSRLIVAGGRGQGSWCWWVLPVANKETSEGFVGLKRYRRNEKLLRSNGDPYS